MIDSMGARAAGQHSRCQMRTILMASDENHGDDADNNSSTQPTLFFASLVVGYFARCALLCCISISCRASNPQDIYVRHILVTDPLQRQPRTNVTNTYTNWR